MNNRFRKKPIVIEAFTVGSAWHLYPDRAAELPQWLREACETGVVTFVEDHCHIRTSEGVMRGDPHDWIIQGVKGELYPCKPDIFTATYEPAA